MLIGSLTCTAAPEAHAQTDDAQTDDAQSDDAQTDSAQTNEGVASEAGAAPVATVETGGPFVDLSVPLTVNGRFAGDISVRVNAFGYGDVQGKRLLELLEPRIDKATFETLVEMVGDTPNVAMDRLGGDAFSIRFDPGLLQVDAVVSGAALGLNTIGVRTGVDIDPNDFDAPEAFTLGLGMTLNHGYRFSGPNGSGFKDLRANVEGFAQLGGFGGTALFYGFDVTDRKGETFRRREVQLIKDFYGPSIRATLGDINAPLTAFQSAPSLLGLNVAREYRAIQPFQNIVSSGRGSLVLDRDSRVEVYVNGILAETLDLPSGRYDLTDFPVTTGSNDVQLVVEDETGRRETTEFSFFSQSGLLGEGLLDFSATAGVERNPTRGGFRYDDAPIVSGFADYGLLSWLTVGANGQFRKARQQVGASATVGTPIGLFNADIARSFGDDLGQGKAEGWAYGMDYRSAFETGAINWTLNGSAIYKTRRFSTLSLTAADNQRLIAQGLLRAQMPNGLSVGLSGNYRDDYDRPDEVRANLSVGKAFNRMFANVSADYIKTDGEDAEYELTVGLTYRLGERDSVRGQYTTREDTALLEYVRSRRRELGDVSGCAQISRSDKDQRLLTDLDYRHNRFEAELDLDVIDPIGASNVTGATETSADWRISSFAGYTGGVFGVGRRADEGFALVSRHATLGESDVVVMDQSGRQREARAGGLLGAALVPIDRAYSPRGYSIEADPLPPGYDIGSGRIDILPGIGTGYAFTIGSDASRTVLGSITDGEGEPIKLAVGTLESVDGDETLSRQFFSNSAGRIVAERVAPGEYVLVIEGRTSDPITITKDSEGLVNVGTIIFP